MHAVLSPLRTSAALSEAEVDAFRETGVVRLGRVLAPERAARLAQRIDDLMLGRRTIPGMMMQLDSATGAYADAPVQTTGHKGATLAYRKIEQLERDPLFLAYLQLPLIHDLCRRLIGPEVRIFRSMFMNKPAGKGTVLPWHQDGGTIWNLTGDPLVTLWLALDPATTANGCVQVVPGSHRLGLLSERGHTITMEQERTWCTAECIVPLEMAAGEVVLLHNWVLHASGTNATGAPRRAFSACLMDGAIRSRDPRTEPFPVLHGAGALPPSEERL